MKKETPQFFGATTGQSEPNEALSSDRAIYTIPGKTEGDAPTLVLVECLEGGGNVPRKATTFQDLKLNLQQEMAAVARVADTAVEALRKLSPGEVKIAFGVELGGSAGIPMITKTEGKANFKVTVTWNGSEK